MPNNSFIYTRTKDLDYLVEQKNIKRHHLDKWCELAEGSICPFDKATGVKLYYNFIERRLDLLFINQNRELLKKCYEPNDVYEEFDDKLLSQQHTRQAGSKLCEVSAVDRVQSIKFLWRSVVNYQKCIVFLETAESAVIVLENAWSGETAKSGTY